MDQKKKITHEEIFEIQRKQLLQWKSVLKPEIYEALEKHVFSMNEQIYDSPYDIFRGGSMDNYIHNNLMKKWGEI